MYGIIQSWQHARLTIKLHEWKGGGLSKQGIMYMGVFGMEWKGGLYMGVYGINAQATAKIKKDFSQENLN